MISKHYKNYKNFGKCLELSNGEIKALITVDIGPRIIFYGYKGYNLMYEDINRKVQKSGEFFDKNFKAGETWYAYGGHRLWRADEDLGSYEPDNYPVKVERLENGAIFTPALQAYTKLQAVTKIIMQEDGEIEITQSYTNKDDVTKTLSLWGITAVRQGGVEVIPLNDKDTGLLPSQNFVYWSYDDKKDKRFSISSKYAVLKQNKNNEKAFKVSLYNHFGWSGYFVGKYFYLRKFDVIDAVHTDYQSNYETYVSGDYLEMEVMGPQVTLAPEQSATMVERFKAYKGAELKKYDDESIATAISSIIK